ncbi:homoserine kinase [Marinobacterium arenosum]|uniref:homoserine kinase n=1 Tax=Marinobacterium arenosum TaxID=2862496 RepID=UPI001C93C5B1|nr:homoserine kinase [Marinobacterium arenosum]MBY4678687.1 homoserine kinase [Marinobacterium arenosum]
MAVYTTVTRQDLEPLLSNYDLGQASDLQGIEGGIENTNYFLTLEQDGQQQQYVLTLFEELGEEEVPFFIELGQWLAERGVPVPYGIKDRNGIALHQLHKRPTILQPRFTGRHISQAEIRPRHCAAIGCALAQFHLAGEQFFLKRQAHRGLFWWRRESARIASHLSAEDAQLLKAEVEAFDQLREHIGDQLPQGAIHGDLFHDNALFDGDRINAILDIYNAATGYWLYDLAIVANDWCCNPDGSIDPAREQALLSHYGQVRPFCAAEYDAWPVLVRTAAMRFWLSRLLPWLGLEQDGSESGDKKLKDPDELKRILLARRATPTQLPR